MSAESIKSNDGETEKKLPPPRKPNFCSGYIWGVIIGVLIILLAFLTENVLQGFFVVLLGAFIGGGTLYVYSSARKQYNLYYTDYQAYLDSVKKDQEQLQKQTEAKIIELEKIPACPVCGSRNVSKISTLNRSASVAAFGLASSKIGKQYECKSCKHKW